MIEMIIGTIGVGFLGVIGWIIQLGNRLSVVEARRIDLETLINMRFDSVDQRLVRIERTMNGHLKD